MTVEEATDAYLRNLERSGSPLVFDARTFWEGYQAGALTIAKLLAASLAEREVLLRETAARNVKQLN